MLDTIPVFSILELSRPHWPSGTRLLTVLEQLTPMVGLHIPRNRFYLCRKASVAFVWRSGFQLKDCGTWYVSLDANISTSIGPSVLTIL